MIMIMIIYRGLHPRKPRPPHPRCLCAARFVNNNDNMNNSNNNNNDNNNNSSSSSSNNNNFAGHVCMLCHTKITMMMKMVPTLLLLTTPATRIRISHSE